MFVLCGVLCCGYLCSLSGVVCVDVCVFSVEPCGLCVPWCMRFDYFLPSVVVFCCVVRSVLYCVSSLLCISCCGFSVVC